MEATIMLEYGDAKTAGAIVNAVSPDNLKAPAGLFIKTLRKGTCVLTEVKTEVKLATFLATIDDLLFSVCTAEKTLHTVTNE